MNVQDKTVESIYELIKQLFLENRIFDRLVSVLGVDFACSNSASKIHEKISHYFPLLSDKIGEKCLERYNISIQYGSTPEAKKDYISVEEIIQIMEDEVVTTQNMYMGAMKVAFENNDLQVYSDLSDLLVDYNKIVEQVILLNDKIKAYGSNVMGFDHDIDTFWIL
jgi:hypothetical protein